MKLLLTSSVNILQKHNGLMDVFDNNLKVRVVDQEVSIFSEGEWRGLTDVAI